jgi:anaerobic sulfite reductase subunit B
MASARAEPMTPAPHRVVGRRVETSDVVTLDLEPLSGPGIVAAPGQFNMLTAFGVGEVAISVSSAPHEARLRHSVRDVGAVTRAICALRVGAALGVRGPFGTDWAIDDARDGDVVVVAGGIGLAPLRGAVEALVARHQAGGPRVFVLVGARDPSQVVYGDDLAGWAARGAHVEVTVDRGAPGWTGPVGLVTALLAGAGFDARGARALVCGPEVMMRFSARALVDLGVDPARVLVSLERNMQCGVGWCGHCQLGPLLLCRDGPVVPYASAVERLMTERER